MIRLLIAGFVLLMTSTAGWAQTFLPRDARAPERWLSRQRWFVRANDKDGDGRLSSAELKEALHGVDRDSDGTITQEEAARALIGADALLTRLYDLDGNGFLDDAEWKAARIDLDRDNDGQFSDWEAERVRALRFLLASPWVVQRHDSNGDGRLDRREAAEAEKAADRNRDGWLDQREASVYVALCSPAWKRFDTDGDGKLSAEETGRLESWIDQELPGVKDPAWPVQRLAKPGTGFLEKYDY